MAHMSYSLNSLKGSIVNARKGDTRSSIAANY